MAKITIHFDQESFKGRFSRQGVSDSVWSRLETTALSHNTGFSLREGTLEVPWDVALSTVYSLAALQTSLDFRFVPGDDRTMARLQAFMLQMQELKRRPNEREIIDPEDIKSELKKRGFDRRDLTEFQLRDLSLLLSLSNGANFSVPGAGKTTVTLALNTMIRDQIPKMLVISPKSAFPAWTYVVEECCVAIGPAGSYCEEFQVLRGDEAWIKAALASSSTRFVTNYETLVNNAETFADYLSSGDVHLVLDESHRMKAGRDSQRGSVLLDFSPAPARRDILSGTPMPQSSHDIESQLDFLWPGAGLGSEVARGAPPSSVISGLYARTMKSELGLKPPKRHFDRVPMAEGQLALYGIVRDEFLRDASKLGRGNRNVNFSTAKRSIMRLLQISANPEVALKGILGGDISIEQGIVDKVLDDPYSTKMLRTAQLVKELASDGRKVVVWTIFTDTIFKLERLLSDFGPVSLYGAVPSGEPTDPNTREGRLQQFHANDDCMVLIANPAAAGEGISLHTVCHDAIYVDRSFVSTHYLQSIDRIHRLGLPPDVETSITILQTTAPAGLGCIDFSVNRRLATKLRALETLLDDPDLHLLALDEEEAGEPIDFEIDMEDILDLIVELEGRAPDQDDKAADLD